MPLGYEKIRDSLIAQGKPEQEAKTIAAKIWNSKHKGAEAVGPHYDAAHAAEELAAAFDDLVTLARADMLKKYLPDVVSDPFWARAKKGGFLQSEAAQKLNAFRKNKIGATSGLLLGAL